MASESPYHALDFFHDDEDGSALTVLLNGVRFHVIADAEKLGCRSKSSLSETAQEYLRLLEKVRRLDKKHGQPEDSDGEYGSATADSGVDMTAPKTDGSLNDCEKKLHAWMLAPLDSAFKDHAPAPKRQHNTQLNKWYDCPTHFFELKTGTGGLEATELEASQEMQGRMRALRPELKIPKYIRDVDVPWYSASDLTVLACSDELAAYHPCRVHLKDSKDDRTFFIKVVDEPGPNKREIKLLNRITQLDLHSEISCPRLEGLVTFSSPASIDYSRNTILGFLQTDIKNPVPLTHKLDPSIPQEQREKWAEEADRTKAVLHKNGIVWGDAKADNFMVDEDDRLWIIDFGGSYTEGWVDKELNETKEGDDMGVLKIVNALEDPVANTFGSDDEEEADSAEGAEVATKPHHSRKRSATDDLNDCVMERKTKTPRLFVTQPSDKQEMVDEQEEEEDGDKESDFETETDQDVKEDEPDRKDSSRDDDSISEEPEPTEQNHESHPIEEPVYCYCHSASSGNMIACDQRDCENQWFHFDCAGLTSAPSKGEEWYCRDCAASSA